MFDLACFVFYLCTRERLLPEDDDFNYEKVQAKVDLWLKLFKEQGDIGQVPEAVLK